MSDYVFVDPDAPVFVAPDPVGPVSTLPAVSEPVMSPAESWKSFGIRAFKTFVQGATAVLLANALDIFDATAVEAAFTGGFGALVSFVNNWASAAEAPKATTAK
jgi:hypothetical protein